MKILISGANGYIGRRLKLSLLENKKNKLRLFVRNKESVITKYQNIEVYQGTILNKKDILKATENIDVAYYLIHLMHSEVNYKEKEILAANNFIQSCIENKVKRVIYLGSLGGEDKSSTHIQSRYITGQILSSHPRQVKCIWFRAGAIIGSGSASYEIIRNLVQKLPIFILPKWLNTKTQTININDTLKYLIQAKDIKIKNNKIVDLGSNKLNFKEMLRETCKIMNLKRIEIPIPFLSTKISSYWLILFTPVPYSIASSLVRGLNYEIVKKNNNAEKLFPNIKPLNFTESIKQTLKEIDNQVILSRWSDSFKTYNNYYEPNQYSLQTILKYSIKKDISKFKKEEIFNKILHLGGDSGWLKYHFLWKIRGLIDKIFFKGYGISRGRRDNTKLRIGDSLDFWRVVDIKPNERLLLISEMKLPGRGWLEFYIENNKLIQTAYFVPRGLIGRIYWFSLYLVHYLTFHDISNNILRSQNQNS